MRANMHPTCTRILPRLLTRCLQLLLAVEKLGREAIHGIGLQLVRLRSSPSTAAALEGGDGVGVMRVDDEDI